MRFGVEEFVSDNVAIVRKVFQCTGIFWRQNAG